MALVVEVVPVLLVVMYLDRIILVDVVEQAEQLQLQE
tara:strand:+ start:444 stop:554 length:111 start_codon:yes stop_codon:yes gene_type:complete